MGVFVEIFKMLPQPFNTIAIIIFIASIILIAWMLLLLIYKISSRGFSFGKFSIEKEKEKENKGEIILTEETIDKLFNVFIETITDTIDKTKNKRMSEKMSIVENKLNNILKCLKSRFAELLKEKKINEKMITLHDDYITFDLTLKTILYLQNGIKSFKTILKDELQEKTYLSLSEENFEIFIEEFNNKFEAVFNNVIEQAYKTSTLFGMEDKLKFRVISAEESKELYKECWKGLIKKEINDLFLKSIDIDKKHEKREKENIQNNINSIKSILLGDSNEKKDK